MADPLALPGQRSTATIAQQQQQQQLEQHPPPSRVNRGPTPITTTIATVTMANRRAPPLPLIPRIAINDPTLLLLRVTHGLVDTAAAVEGLCTALLRNRSLRSVDVTPDAYARLKGLEGVIPAAAASSSASSPRQAPIVASAATAGATAAASSFPSPSPNPSSGTNYWALLLHSLLHLPLRSLQASGLGQLHSQEDAAALVMLAAHACRVEECGDRRVFTGCRACCCHHSSNGGHNISLTNASVCCGGVGAWISKKVGPGGTAAASATTAEGTEQAASMTPASAAAAAAAVASDCHRGLSSSGKSSARAEDEAGAGAATPQPSPAEAGLEFLDLSGTIGIFPPLSTATTATATTAGLHDALVRRLSVCLFSIHSTLRTADLSGCAVGDTGLAALLATFLSQGPRLRPRLRSLKLRWNGLTGCEATTGMLAACLPPPPQQQQRHRHGTTTSSSSLLLSLRTASASASTTAASPPQHQHQPMMSSSSTSAAPAKPTWKSLGAAAGPLLPPLTTQGTAAATRASGGVTVISAAALRSRSESLTHFTSITTTPPSPYATTPPSGRTGSFAGSGVSFTCVQGLSTTVGLRPIAAAADSPLFTMQLEGNKLPLRLRLTKGPGG